MGPDHLLRVPEEAVHQQAQQAQAGYQAHGGDVKELFGIKKTFFSTLKMLNA